MTEQLPIFPLSTVLYPGLVLPLHIFEGRYRQMVRDLEALPEGQRQFGIVAVRHGRAVPEGTVDRSTLYDVGCIAKVREIDRLDDGRYALVTVGGRRFRLGALDGTRRYLQAEVDLLGEPPGDEPAALVTMVAQLFAQYRLTLTGSAGDLEFVDDPELVSYVVAAAMVLELHDKQALLEAGDTAQRLTAEALLLRRETRVLSVLPSLPAVDLFDVTLSMN